jgi:hypothetical protein
MGKDVMMSTKEAQRFALIQQVLSKSTTQRAAASQAAQGNPYPQPA